MTPPSSRGPWVVLAGPLAARTWSGRFAGLFVVLVLTVLTEVLGLFVWPALGIAASGWRHAARWAWIAAGIGAVASWMLVPVAARLGGREALPCFTHDTLGPRTLLTCAAHRHYVRPALGKEVRAIALRVAERHPGSVVRFLDAGFPFRGLPLLPHLSHHDGRKIDLALLYVDAEGQPIDGGGSPIGYFGYVAPDRAPACPARWWDLRWDFEALQPLIAPRLDRARTRTLLTVAAARPGIGKLLLEPHLTRRLGLDSHKVRFQGCRAARHDDHVHLQL